MSEERMAVVKKHIAELERLAQFYHDCGDGTEKTISLTSLIGTFAEIFTRIDELVEWKKFVNCALVRLEEKKDEICPGDKIVDVTCPCCGAKLEITHGDDEGEIAVIGTPVPFDDPMLEARVKELERKDAEMAESMTDQYDEVATITRPALESIINRISRIEREVAELKRR
jgi:hypothetical protein